MSRTSYHLACGILFAAATLLTGCGGGGGSSGPSDGDSDASDNRVGLAARDAEAEQLSSLQIMLESAALVRADGSMEALLENRTEIDFATLTEVDQLIADADIDAGSYSALDLTLDLSTATAWIKGQSSEARIEDGDGNLLAGMQSLRVEFSSNDVLRVDGSSHSMVVLDMDLNASVTVDELRNTVSLEPRFLLETETTAEERPLTLRGTVSTDSEGALIVALNGDSESQFELRSSDDTVFHIDGEVTVGLDGESQVSGGTDILLSGELGAEGEFRAETVFSGGGVLGLNLNGGASIQGVVTGRITNPLTNEIEIVVSGATVVDGSGAAQYEQVIRVETSALTRIQTEGNVRNSTATDLSVGQEITATGILAGSTLSAQAGVITLHETRIAGVVTDTGNGEVEIALTSIEGRSSTLFDFSDSGGTNQSSFTVDISAVSNSNLQVGDGIILTGISTGSMASANADFVASTSAAAESSLRIDYGSGEGTTASVDAGGDSVVITGPLPVNSEVESETEGSTSLSGESEATIELMSQGRYVLDTPDGQTTYQSAARLRAALQVQIDAGLSVIDIRADGQYDADAEVMTASQALFAVE